MHNLRVVIEKAWEARAEINFKTQGEVREAVNATLLHLDGGKLRVAQQVGSGKWEINEWVKKAILLYFRLHDNRMMGVEGLNIGYDKVPLKIQNWGHEKFLAESFRTVPGAVVRYGSHIAKGVVLMPSFVNIGAFVDEGTMVDTWATIGSCAQIGKNCHISGGTGIGGVLEPLQANPVIIEDNCFIGARSEIAEGVIVETGAVISMGVFIGASTKIVDRATGEIFYGRVPAYSVVVPGNLPGKTPNSPSLYCAVIVKRVDEKTRSKTGINELLRD